VLLFCRSGLITGLASPCVPRLLRGVFVHSVGGCGRGCGVRGASRLLARSGRCAVVDAGRGEDAARLHSGSGFFFFRCYGSFLFYDGRSVRSLWRCERGRVPRGALMVFCFSPYPSSPLPASRTAQRAYSVFEICFSFTLSFLLCHLLVLFPFLSFAPPPN
jgi:hypothetical protein